MITKSFISGAILLSLYYLFLWDPYKYTGPPPTQSPEAQSNSPATTFASVLTSPSLVQNYQNPSTLSDEALDSLVEDLNDGVQPKTLALNLKAMAAREKQKMDVKNNAQHGLN